MYKIGEFSKIVDIPVRTLRYYDEFGVLKPSHIDCFTGYRYYTEENIIECELIKLLKSLDFTLEEINEYKDSLNETIIETKKQQYIKQIQLLKLKFKRLSILEKDLKNQKQILKPEERIKTDKILRRNYIERKIS